ncbi:cell wall integrity and stress response component 4-like [Elysia marginata]|uniref:Cell wall integrity and stress response component 4-like n=1 Tax=Elysia marginata TaxID=1093978 RepID=A0AAV4HJX2_9GAST|nr:cell wall integrity and stress response component 4-like [Elysia marginata]
MFSSKCNFQQHGQHDDGSGLSCGKTKPRQQLFHQRQRLVAILPVLPTAAFLFKVCLLVAFVPDVSASGMLIEPTMRSALWRFDPEAPINYNDQGLNCGGLQVQYGINGGLCGVCGDPFSGLRENEDGGLYASGGVVRRYRSGSRVTMVADLVVPKGGYFEVKLCPRDQLATMVTQECFDAFTLKILNGRGRRLKVGKRLKQDSGLYKLEVQLPPGITCTHCVIQWRYVTAPSSPSADFSLGATGSSCPDCPGPREEFRNCADVTIGYYGDEEATVGQPDDLTLGYLSDRIQTYVFGTGVDPTVVNVEKTKSRFASSRDFTGRGAGGDSSEEEDDDDDGRRYRPGRFSEWPQRLPSSGGGQGSGFGYATLLLGGQGRGDQALGRIRENLNRNNRQELRRRQRGGSSEDSDEDSDEDDDEDYGVSFPRRLPGFENNINEVLIPAINENYDKHNGRGVIDGASYNDPYNDLYNDQYNDPYGDTLNDQYNDPYGDTLNDQYNDPYGDTLNDQYNDQYSDPFNDQNSDPHGSNTGDYSSGLDGNLPGINIDPFAGLFGDSTGGEAYVTPNDGSFNKLQDFYLNGRPNFGDSLLGAQSPPVTNNPLEQNPGFTMNTEDPSNPFVGFFRRDRSKSNFQDRVRKQDSNRNSGMSYAGLMERIRNRQPLASPSDQAPATQPRLSKSPLESEEGFLSPTSPQRSPERGHDQTSNFEEFPGDYGSDYPSERTNVPINPHQTEPRINPPRSPFSPERIINGIRNALERLISPQSSGSRSRKPGILDIQGQMLRDRLARMATLTTRPRERETQAELPGLSGSPIDRISGQTLPLGSVPPLGSLPPGFLSTLESLSPLDPSNVQGLPLSLGPSPSLGPLPPQSPLSPIGSFPSSGSSFPLDQSLSSGFHPPRPLQNENSAAFHWLPESAHDMSAVGGNFHFLNAHAANQYLSPYAEATRAQPALLCGRPELLVCMATPMYRQAIPGADVICTESCRRGEACGPEYCACSCQQMLQCVHQSSLGNDRLGRQRVFAGGWGGSPSASAEDAWCTAQCNTGRCPNDQCVCSLV